MRKGTVVMVLILVILVLSFIFMWVVKFMLPVLILLGFLLICVGALVWVVKTQYKSNEEKKNQ